jgi:hypothetical protein
MHRNHRLSMEDQTPYCAVKNSTAAYASEFIEFQNEKLHLRT